MQEEKVAMIRNSEVPVYIKDLQSFLGFANFYQRFILNCSKVVSPLTKLTGKNVSWQWNFKQKTAFEALKEAFTGTLILQHFDYERAMVAETDTSDYVSEGVLSHPDDNGVLHPVAFFSKKYSPDECNYEIYDKELLATVRSFEEWRPKPNQSRTANQSAYGSQEPGVLRHRVAIEPMASSLVGFYGLIPMVRRVQTR